MRKLMLIVMIPTMLFCNGKPKIKFESLIHDFGKQAQNQELKYIFNFSNSGEGTLLIDKIQPT